MSNAIQRAYREGMNRALRDAGLVKVANIEKVRTFIKEGLTVEPAWDKAYPGEPLPDNIQELLGEVDDE